MPALPFRKMLPLTSHDAAGLPVEHTSETGPPRSILLGQKRPHVLAGRVLKPQKAGRCKKQKAGVQI
jgi:hypothetical protein